MCLRALRIRRLTRIEFKQLYRTQACTERLSALASNFSKGAIPITNRIASSFELFLGMKQGEESPLRCTIAAAEYMADCLYRFREGTYSPRMHRSRSEMAKYDGDPLIFGGIANLGICPDTSHSLDSSVVTKLGGQRAFV